MATYAVTSHDLTFEVKMDDHLVGILSYKGWFTPEASIQTKHSVFQSQRKGFWGSTIEVRQVDQLVLNYTMNWNGDIVMLTHFEEEETEYIFKHCGVFRESFVLIDPEGHDLLVVKLLMKWNRMSYDYEITTTDQFEMLPNKDFLLMSAVHSANYFLSVAMAAFVPGV